MTNLFLLEYLIAQIQAQSTPGMSADQLKQFADEVSQKDFRWWFAFVFALLIWAGSWIIKWLIVQLGEQRKTNSEERDAMLTYMKEDRLKSAVLLERVTMVLERLEEDSRLQTLKSFSASPNQSIQTGQGQHQPQQLKQ